MTTKQLDNLLSRNDLHGVQRKTRGVTRRISSDAAVVINLAWKLSEGARVPIATALGMSRRLMIDSDHSVAVGDHLTLKVNFDGIRADTLARLDAAVEAIGRRRRGRPPGSKRRTIETEL